MNEERNIPQSAAPTAPFRQGGLERAAEGVGPYSENERTPEMIGAEVRMYVEAGRRITLLCGIEIGRRLVEAKEMLQHGEWLPWLEKETGFSTSSAQRYMQVFKEYGAAQQSLFGPVANSPTLGNISISNALRLLAVPEEERESFAQEHDVEHLSAREVEALVKERTAELEAEKQKLEADAQEKEGEILRLTALAQDDKAAREREEQARQKAEENLRRIQQEIKEIESRPQTVAVERDEKAIEEAAAEAKKQAEREAEKKIKELKEQISATASSKDKAEKELAHLRDQFAAAEKAGAESEQLRQQIKTLESRLAVASPEVAEFKAAFDRAQGELVTMLKALRKVQDPEVKAKLSTAAKTVLGNFAGKIEG